MSASDYVKADPIGFGNSLGDIVNAVRGDGVGAHVLDELIASFTASAKAMNEIKDVPEAAVEHILCGMTHTLGDASYARALEAEKAAEAAGEDTPG